SLTGRPFVAPVTPPGAMSMLRLTLNCVAKDATFEKLAPDRLRFFLRGSASEVSRLYEMIFNNAVAVVIADDLDDRRGRAAGPEAILRVGFGADGGLLPSPPRSPLGYRLLTEYFVFPEKFQFFDIDGVGEKARLGSGRKIDIYVFFDRPAPE